MDTQRFKSAPFNLDEPAIDWVERSLGALSLDDKIRQLFNLIYFGPNPEQADTIRAFRPGGITRMMGGGPTDETALIKNLNEQMPTPLLVAADLEGSRMSLTGGAEWPNPLSLAAIDDVEITSNVSQAMAAEAIARGINWSFTPVLDVNHDFSSAIVATRAYGSDVDRIERHAMAQLDAFQQNGIACAVKHFPGEGFDDRDQHLLTTINPLSLDAWKQVFGRLYSTAINHNVLSVMSAHIAFPAYARAMGEEASLENFRPASISRLLNQKLLRDDLGFQGLIVSDATAMAGLGAWSPRSEHLPELISSGCDVILFSDDPEQDLTYLHAALKDGRLTQKRVDDAVSRQLAMKAALGLHKEARPKAAKTPKIDPLKIALKAPTLVKDTAKTLPLTPNTHKRVLVVTGGIKMPFIPHPLPFSLPDMLKTSGFDVTLFEQGTDISPDHYDLILYLLGEETLLTRGRIFLDWLSLTGNFGDAMKRYWHEIPCVMVSFGYPYMLYDAPRMPTYINAYSNTETMQQAVHDLLLGKEEWNGGHPIDPFCGLEDAKY